MNESRKLTANMLHLLAGQGAGKIISIFITAGFAHVLTKKEFATVAVLAILSSITTTVSGLGLETTCLREIPGLLVAGKRPEVSARIRAAGLSRIIISVFIAAVMWIFAERVASLVYTGPEHAGLIRILSVGALVLSVNTGLDLVGQSVGAFKKTAYVEVANALAYGLCALGGYYLAGFHGWAVGLVLSRFAGTGVYVMVLWNWLRESPNQLDWWAMVRRSWPFYLRAFMLYGKNQLDQTIVGLFLSTVTLADYYVARSLLSYIRLVTEAIGRPLIVSVAEIRERSPDEVGHRLNVISRYQCFAFVPLGLMMLSLGNPLLELYGGTKYASAYPLLIILTVATLITVLWGTVYNRGIFVLGSPLENLMVDGVGAVTATLSTIALIQLFGAVGAALGVLIGTLATAAYSAHLLDRHVRTTLDRGALRGSITAGFIATAITLIIQLLIPSELWLLPVYGLVWMVIYVLWVTRYFRNEDYILIERAIGPRFRQWVELLKRRDVQ